MEREPSIEEVSEEEKAIDIPILMYHYVDNIDNKEDGKYNLNTKPQILETQITTLLGEGYKFIKMSEIPVFVDQDSKVTALTFDDGYDDFYHNVLPILKRYNVPATNYIMPEFIGRELHLTETQIKELINSGLVEIGSHTLSHASLTDIDLQSASIEITQSKKSVGR